MGGKLRLKRRAVWRVLAITMIALSLGLMFSAYMASNAQAAQPQQTAPTPVPPVCGNGVCEATEDERSCAADCNSTTTGGTTTGSTDSTAPPTSTPSDPTGATAGTTDSTTTGGTTGDAGTTGGTTDSAAPATTGGTTGDAGTTGSTTGSTAPTTGGTTTGDGSTTGGATTGSATTTTGGSTTGGDTVPDPSGADDPAQVNPLDPRRPDGSIDPLHPASLAVLAIVFFFAAVAIPSFMKNARKAKTAEANAWPQKIEIGALKADLNTTVGDDGLVIAANLGEEHFKKAVLTVRKSGGHGEDGKPAPNAGSTKQVGVLRAGTRDAAQSGESKPFQIKTSAQPDDPAEAHYGGGHGAGKVSTQDLSAEDPSGGDQS